MRRALTVLLSAAACVSAMLGGGPSTAYGQNGFRVRVPPPAEDETPFTISAGFPAELPLESADRPTARTQATSASLELAPPLANGPGVPGWGTTNELSPVANSGTDWRSLLQKAIVRSTFETTWVAPGDVNAPEMIDIQGNTSIGTPGSTVQRALILTPGYGIHLWGQEQGIPLPSQVYDFYLDIYWRQEVGAWVFDAAVTPGYYSDLEQESSEGIRTFGRLVANYRQSERLTLSFGVAYLDREQYNIIPVTGLIWQPNDRVLVEALFPRPRAALRIVERGDSSGWIYLGGEIGGGSWATEFADGSVDRLEYVDYRVVGGWEWRSPHRLKYKAEAGYVFGREWSRPATGQEWDSSDTWMTRVGLLY